MKNQIIRSAQIKDVDALLILSDQLGYPSSEKDILIRIEKILASPNDKIFVSQQNNIITGWIHVFGSLRIESDPFAEIGGLVVKSEFRNNGIGKALVNAAEKWAKDNGYSEIRVRSRIERTDARRFYERGNYFVKKTQNVFEKKL